MTYLSIASMAKATRLFWPPDRLSIGRKANSPETPNEPSCLRYSSSGFPGNKNIIHDEWLKMEPCFEGNVCENLIRKWLLSTLRDHCKILLLCCNYLETVTVIVAQNSYSCLTDPRDVGWNTPVSNSCKTNWKKKTLLTHCFLRGFSQNE